MGAAAWQACLSFPVRAIVDVPMCCPRGYLDVLGRLAPDEISVDDGSEDRRRLAHAVPVSPAMSPALNVGFMAPHHAICRTAEGRLLAHTNDR